jgi:dihydroflavonol-4-reductase
MILVTGGTGFLGSVLVRQLLDAGESVRILRRETSKLDLLGDASGRVEHAVGDLTDPEALREAVRGAQVVYHTAAYVGFGGQRDAERLHAVNVEGTAHVVDAALTEGVGRLVHTSSMAAFGRPERPPEIIDEAAEWVPSPMNTAYAKSKYASELEVQRGIAEGMDAVIVNPAVIFGPGRGGENTTAIVERARSGSRFAPAGGTNVVDVEDVAAGMRAAMARGVSGRRYFLGSENLRWVEILGTLADALGQRRPTLIVPPLAAQAAGIVAEVGFRLIGRRPTLTRETARLSSRFYRYTNRKAREELGCTFRPFTATAERIAAEG